MRGEFHHQRVELTPYTSDDKGRAESYTEVQLARIWEDVLGIESIGRDQNYFDLGGDSSLTVQMFSRIEQVFKVKLPLPMLFEAPTIAELARNLDREISEAPCSSLVPIQPSGSRPPFFCVHGASGSVSMYHDLSRRLGSDQPFYGLQAQGLDGAGPTLTKIEDMAALYIKEIKKVRPQGPYFLGGYSMGGTIAFEMARQLCVDDDVPLVALMDTMNWSKVPAPSGWDRNYYTAQRIGFRVASFLRLDLISKLKTLVQGFKNGHSGVVNRQDEVEIKDAASSQSVQTQVWEANDLACSTYIPKSYAGAVVDFRPLRQYRVYNKAELKWNSLAQSVQEVVLPVYPDEMLTEPFVKYLAVALRLSIEHKPHTSENCEASGAAVEVA